MFWVPNATAAATSASSAGYIPAKTPSESGSDKVSQKIKHFRIREINQTQNRYLNFTRKNYQRAAGVWEMFLRPHFFKIGSKVI
jgi:hypothetical protein